MKVALLIGQCTSDALNISIGIIKQVLSELDVEVESIDLKELPYFNNKHCILMDKLVEDIEESKGVIILTEIPMLGMHGSVQSFFEHTTRYQMKSFDKPMLVLTYSDWLGENEAAQSILRCWNTIGGIEAGMVCINKISPIELVKERVEKEIENFYRYIKQERPNLPSSERMYYVSYRQEVNKSDTTLIEGKKISGISGEQPIYKKEAKTNQEQVKDKRVNSKVDYLAKEQTIKEIATLIDKETKGNEFRQLNSGVYTKPPQVIKTVKAPNRIQQIPHYFIAQYDKTIDLKVQYQLIDLKEQGYIVINQGDCSYQDEINGKPTVELILEEAVLLKIIEGKITYQKAFMTGKLKVKGNFSVLPQLDKIFKNI